MLSSLQTLKIMERPNPILAPPPEEFIFYDVGLVWANRPAGLGPAPENEFFPWSSIATVVWREPTQWLPQTLAIRGTDPLWDRTIKFRNLSDKDRDNLLSNLAQYVSVSREENS